MHPTISIINPLPIRLLSFTGMAVAEGVRLDWSTASESGNAGFDIERSPDGISFERIGSVSSNEPGGNSTQTQKYTYTDASAAPQIIYYRLRQNDLDGGFTYSTIVRIAGRTAPAAQLSMFPNPAHGNVSLDIATGSSADESVYIAIVNTSGTAVMTRAVDAKGGRLSTALDLSALTTGRYFVQVRTASTALQTQSLTLNN